VKSGKGGIRTRGAVKARSSA